MKTRFCAFLLLIVLLVSLASCGYQFEWTDALSDPASRTVTLCPGNGDPDTILTVPTGERISTPAAPTKEGYVFLGWYTDEACTELHDFSRAVTGNLTLWAGYLPDYGSWTNRLTASFVPVTVCIWATAKTGGFFSTETSSKLGSGVIFYRNSNEYYLLTNNHVVAFPDLSSPTVSYVIEDYRGARYEGASLLASDASYDLAVLRFRGPTGKDALPVAALAHDDAPEGESVAALGHPSGQKNALTYGEVQGYREAQTAQSEEESHVTFPVLHHSAPIASGSSGGAVVNTSLEIVALNYAGIYADDGTLRFSLAIPVTRIREFLTAAGVAFPSD